jgi:hypothetical protein
LGKTQDPVFLLSAFLTEPRFTDPSGLQSLSFTETSPGAGLRLILKKADKKSGL